MGCGRGSKEEVFLRTGFSLLTRDKSLDPVEGAYYGRSSKKVSLNRFFFGRDTSLHPDGFVPSWMFEPR
jgi:hypothetical protein